MLLLNGSVVLTLAAQPVATLTCGGYVKVDGTVLPTAGIPNWPLASGDIVETASDPVVLRFPDGARATLGKNARVVIHSCGRFVVQIEEGAAGYQVPQSSKFQICALGHAVKPAPLTEGNVRIEDRKVFVQVLGSGQVEADKGECACDAGAGWRAQQKVPLFVATGGVAAGPVTLAITLPSSPGPTIPGQ